MNIKIIFHNSLIKYTDCKEITMNISCFDELQRGLYESFPKLKQYVNWLFNNSNTPNECICVLYNDKKHMPDTWKYLDYFPEDIEVFYIIPCVYGTNQDVFPIILGLVLVIGSIFTAGALAAPGAGLLSGFAAGTAGALAKATLGIGINLLLSGIMQFVLKPPEPADPGSSEGAQRQNSIFGPLQNTIDTGTPIPLIFGEHRTSGHFISGYIKAVEHGRSDVITVQEQFS